MSAADNETIARKLPRVLKDAFSTLRETRAAAEGAEEALDGVAHERTDALAAARAADLAGAADAESRSSQYDEADRRQRVAAHEKRRAIEEHREAIESLEDRVTRARTWLADARAGGASAESVAAAERAIATAERRAYAERLLAEDRGWIRRARSSARAQVVAPAAPSKSGDADSDSTTDAAPTKRRGLPRDEANVRAREILQARPDISAKDLAAEIPCATGQIPKLPAWRAVMGRRREEALARSVHATAMDPELLDLIADQQADMEADERRPARRAARQRKRLAD